MSNNSENNETVIRKTISGEANLVAARVNANSTQIPLGQSQAQTYPQP